MELNIQHETSVRDVQNEFSKYFPYLQIQFYRNGRNEKFPSVKTGKVNTEEPVKQLMKRYQPLKLIIGEDTTVGDLQKVFSDYGLNIQVFRKFGTFWIQTTLTDDWTLDRQNKEALMLSLAAGEPSPDTVGMNGMRKSGS